MTSHWWFSRPRCQSNSKEWHVTALTSPPPRLTWWRMASQRKSSPVQGDCLVGRSAMLGISAKTGEGTKTRALSFFSSLPRLFSAKRCSRCSPTRLAPSRYLGRREEIGYENNRTISYPIFSHPLKIENSDWVRVCSPTNRMPETGYGKPMMMSEVNFLT